MARRKKEGTGHALPAFSVNTEQEVKDIFVRFGRLGYDGVYRWTDFDGDFESLEKVGKIMAKHYTEVMA